MTAALALATRPAYPLGKPADRDRYGMTHEMAALYRWLVENRPHDRAFLVNFRQASTATFALANTHAAVLALVDRGWLERDDAGYRFVAPIMFYKEAR